MHSGTSWARTQMRIVDDDNESKQWQFEVRMGPQRTMIFCIETRHKYCLLECILCTHCVNTVGMQGGERTLTMRG